MRMSSQEPVKASSSRGRTPRRLRRSAPVAAAAVALIAALGAGALALIEGGPRPLAAARVAPAAPAVTPGLPGAEPFTAGGTEEGIAMPSDPANGPQSRSQAKL